MKKIILTLSLLMLISLTSFGQKKRTSSIILTQQETANLFTDSLKKQLGINYPIRSVYKCKDKSGIFYMVLTETNDNITTSSDTLHHNIKAFNFFIIKPSIHFISLYILYHIYFILSI